MSHLHVIMCMHTVIPVLFSEERSVYYMDVHVCVCARMCALTCVWVCISVRLFVPSNKF
jgi:hypothetical protein